MVKGGGARHLPAVLWSAVAVTLVFRVVASAIVLHDPDHFQVKRTWSGAALGIPANLGGLVFSPAGDQLYVIGHADEPTSAVYALPVTRVAGEVTDLGPATRLFGATTATGGLDAGLEFGPAGTLFYVYFQTNLLAERPGGVGGGEVTHDLSSRDVRAPVSGLTFAPARVDPDTGFGPLQVGTGFGQDILEIPLTDAGGGVFVPGPATRFVRLPLAGTAGLQYVPAGTFGGNLLYVNFDEGQLRLLMVDRDTGFPIEATTGIPTLGTTDPVDGVFASEFGFGPIGLEFDAQTKDDLFVTTFAGAPENSIIQIGGFTATFTTTTTTATATTSSNTSTTDTVPSSTAPSTTATTSSTATTAPPSTSASSTTTTVTVASTTGTIATTTSTDTVSTTATTASTSPSTTSTSTSTSTSASASTASSSTVASTSSTSLPPPTTTSSTAPPSTAASTTTATTSTATTTELPPTTVASTTSTTVTSTSASTRPVPPTTLPPPDVTDCPTAPTLVSVACRLDALAALVREGVERASLRGALLGRVGQAGAQAAIAAGQMTTGGRRSARTSLRRAAKAVARFRATVRSRAGRRAIAPAGRAAFRIRARAIQVDLRRIRREV